MQVGIDGQPPGVPCDFCVSIHGWHERCSFEIDLRCAPTVAVVHGLRGPLYNCHAINRNLCVLLIVIISLSIWFLSLLSRRVVRGTLAGWRWILIVRRGWRVAVLVCHG